MRRKKIKKVEWFSKIMAVILAVILVGNTMGIQPFVKAENSEDVSEVAPAEYEVIGVADFFGGEVNLASGGSARGTKVMASGATMDGVMINGKFTFSGNAYMNIGQNANGLQISRAGAATLRFKIIGNTGPYLDVTSEAAGCELFDKEVHIRVGFTFVNEQADGTTDVTVQVQIGPTYRGEFTVTGEKTSSYLRYIVCYASTNATYPSAALKLENVKKDADYTVLDIEDFTGLEEYTVENSTEAGIYQFAKTAGEGTLDGIMIDGVYHLSGNSILDIGAQWKGLQMSRAGENTLRFQSVYTGGYKNLIDITSEDAGCALFDTDVRMRIGFTFSNYDAEAGTADVDIHIKIGSTYENIILVTGMQTANLQKTIFLYAKDSAAYTGSSLTMKAVRPDGLVEVTPEDFGIANGTYDYDAGLNTSGNASRQQITSLKNSYTNSTATINLLDKVFVADVQFSGTAPIISIAGPGDWNGLRFGKNSAGNLYFNNTSTAFTFGSKEFVLDTTKAGLSTADDEFNLKISIEKVALGKGGSEDDVKYGIWINNKLYDGKYIYTKNNASTIGAYAFIYCSTSGGSVTISTAQQQIPDDNTPYILEDFGVEHKKYESVGNVQNGISGSTKSSSISGKISLSGTEAGLRLYGTPSNAWAGISFSMTSSGLNLGSAIDGTKDTIKQTYADVTAGDVFDFTVAEEVLDLDADGSEDDIRLSVWVNTQCKRFYLLDFAGVIRKAAILYVNASGSSATVEPSVEAETYNLDESTNGYLVSGKGEITVNKVSTANGTTLCMPGDYIIRCAQKGAYVKSVVLYKTGDAHVDGKVDVCDLVAAKKLASGEQAKSKAAKEGADFDRNNIVNETDCGGIRKYLAGSVTLPTAKVSYLTYEKDVMPIVGFYGPYNKQDSKGTTYNLMTDDIFEKVKDAGINLISYTSADYRSTPKDVLSSLAFAEKYGIGMYINDARYSGTQDAKTLALCQRSFSEYSSFKGNFVVDEPYTADYIPEGTGYKMLEDYSNKIQLLNSYSNSIGYVNMNPMISGKAEAEYKTYADTCLGLGAKVISWDYHLWDEDKTVDQYFRHLSIMREKSLEKGLPFWTHIQAGANWYEGETGALPTSNNTPTTAQLLWNVNTSLAYGAKGIQYFTLVQHPNHAYVRNLWGEWTGYDYERNGLIGANGVPTKWYTDAQNANKQIAAVDEYLLYSKTLDVLAIGNEVKSKTGIESESYKDVLTEVTTTNGALIGVFEYQGKTAFYVVNYDTTNEGADDITLHFGDNEQNYSVVSTQLDTEVSGTSGTSCKLSLINGGAALVIMN